MAIKMTQEEWTNRAKELFGEDPLKWKFKCPVCSHIQTPEDFRKYKEQGANPNCAITECIGRYLPKNERGGFSKDHSNPKIKSPCDYAAYGFFRLAPITVSFPDGVETMAFDFAPDETPPCP